MISGLFWWTRARPIVQNVVANDMYYQLSILNFPANTIFVNAFIDLQVFFFISTLEKFHCLCIICYNLLLLYYHILIYYHMIYYYECNQSEKAISQPADRLCSLCSSSRPLLILIFHQTCYNVIMLLLRVNTTINWNFEKLKNIVCKHSFFKGGPRIEIDPGAKPTYLWCADTQI